MGLMKQMKDMRGMIQDAPEMIRGAQAMGAQGIEMGNAQRAAAEAQMAQMTAQQQAMAPPAGAQAAGAGDVGPISGVSLELYAEISRDLASVGYDQSQAAQLAAAKGVAAESWTQALDGWNARIAANPAVAKQFNSLYRGV